MGHYITWIKENHCDGEGERDWKRGWERRKYDEGESLERKCGSILDDLLYHFTFYILNKDMSIFQPSSGILVDRQLINFGDGLNSSQSFFCVCRSLYFLYSLCLQFIFFITYSHAVETHSFRHKVVFLSIPVNNYILLDENFFIYFFIMSSFFFFPFHSFQYKWHTQCFSCSFIP